MLMTGKPDKKAREVPVLEDGVEITRLRAVPDHREWFTFTVDQRPWMVECRWIGNDYQRGEVNGRPADAPAGTAPLRGYYAGTKVHWVVLDGRQLEVSTKSVLRGMHRYVQDGQVLAETGMKGFPRIRTTVTADPAVRRHEGIFLLGMDLYSCRRNTSAAGALRFRSVPTES